MTWSREHDARSGKKQLCESDPTYGKPYIEFLVNHTIIAYLIILKILDIFLYSPKYTKIKKRSGDC